MRRIQTVFYGLVDRWVRDDNITTYTHSIRGEPTDNDISVVVTANPAPRSDFDASRTDIVIKVQGSEYEECETIVAKVLRLCETFVDGEYNLQDGAPPEYTSENYDGAEWTVATDGGTVRILRIDFGGSDIDSDRADLFVYTLLFHVEYLEQETN